ncbi:MAG: GCN5-related N-acetyltransferase [Frankiales bacterium]|nr:GCN5-related N-acetyltransferase [Frankiales bacterium]
MAPVAYGPTSGSQAFDIGISIPAGVPRPGARQPGAAAARRYLFCTTAVHRVQASTDAENAAERAAPVRAGFTEEGLLRGAQWRAGGFRDLVGYARLRTGA